MAKIRKIRWDPAIQRVAVTIEGYDGIEPCFDLGDIRDSEDLRQKIRDKLTQIDQLALPSPEVIPSKVNVLKEALEEKEL